MATWDTRVKCATMLGILSQTGTFPVGISQLVAMAIHDGDEEVRQAALNSLAKIAGQSDNNQADAIIKEDGLRRKVKQISTIPYWGERLAWAKTLSALSNCAANFDLGRQKLIDLGVEDDNDEVRNESYRGLHALVESGYLKDKVNTALADTFKMALRDSEKQDRALQNLRRDCLGVLVEFDFRNAIKLLSDELLTIALNNEGKSMRKAAETLLTCLISRQQEDPVVFSFILSAISSSIVSLDEEKKLVVLVLVEAVPLEVPNDILGPFAQAVIQLLKNDNGRTRGIALQILRILYKKGLVTKLIESNVSDIVAMALKDNIEKTQVIALRFLANLRDDRELLSEVKSAQPRLMTLLDKRQLRPATVELISFISRDHVVRESVASWVISAMSTESEARLEGVVSLLSTLIIECRPSAPPKGTDIVFFLAPFLALKPSMTKSRTRLMALLWCNYQEFSITGLDYDQDIPSSLLDPFIFSVFGPHVAKHELDAWERVTSRIKFNPQSPSGEGQV
ncbi:hypothetical protein BKA70DRAFT_1313769 [Coprinopsis sp. MPI-PUGE-AT-0042]|nr:hypothetical protein BKA70DRAFT_1313769 [Coprinopsis sp. MPI-PUGE-AT-0042]